MTRSGINLSVYEAYARPYLRELCLYEYLSVVHFHRKGKNTNMAQAKFLPFDDELEEGERWVQELRTNGQYPVPIVTGYLVDAVDSEETGKYCWTAITLLGLFVSREDFVSIDKL